MRQVSQPEVSGEDNDQPKRVDPRRGIRSWYDNLKQRKEAVKAVLGDVRKLRISIHPPRIKQYSPIYDGDEEGVGCYCGVEEGVESLQRAWERRQDGATTTGVGDCVEGGEEEVEG